MGRRKVAKSLSSRFTEGSIEKACRPRRTAKWLWPAVELTVMAAGDIDRRRRMAGFGPVSRPLREHPGTAA